MSITENLKILTGANGVSGNERSASCAAAELLKAYCTDVTTDAFNNVTGFIAAESPDAATLLLDAHIDGIGFVVTHIDEKGFIRVGACGGADMRVLLAQTVVVLGRKPLYGVVSTLPPHVSSDHSKVPEIGDISIDIGMTREQAEQLVSPGDSVLICSAFRTLCADRVSAPFVDDRSGVCAVLEALELMKGRKLRYNIAVSFTAQEETGERGAKQAAFRIQPDEAIVVDVSFGRTPDSIPHETAELGSGAMIGFSAVLDREMSQRLCDICEESGIPYTREVMPGATGTNADSIAVSGRGIKCCTLSFPIRYMHTGVETVDIGDIMAAARLICEYASGGADNA